ncbi:universal stress protein [Emticicia agri]|uniref:Universal stress protein n=1 Tax=Emticicia agri TaxID=2492393 RepID=A0A4Q5LZH1_9BACT|nr:universal stress protein [Emticicia agri]RYU94923.1 universal stress protein [Emticicia agri]
MNLPQSESLYSQPRKTLVAIDLGECSEKIISYLFLFTRDITCEYTIFHCLDGETTEKQAYEFISKILDQACNYRNKAGKSTIKVHMAHNNLIDELQLLHAKENFGIIVIGSTNTRGSWEMGKNAQAILMNLSAAIIAIPPTIELAFPSNVSILVEKVQKSCFDFFNAFHEFVSHYGMFLNFVLFARDKHELREERKLIEEYQDFFDATITFSFIVEQEQTYLNFLQCIEHIHCDSAVLACYEDTTVYRATQQNGTIYCSPKMPILYIKRDSSMSKRNIGLNMI